MEKESVWDYPRPPRLEPFSKPIEVVFNGEIVAKTTHAMRVLETSHPPVYYVPECDIAMEYLTLAAGTSYCEWKGQAQYWDLKVRDKSAEKAAWSYASPTAPFVLIKNFLAFYSNKMDICTVDGEVVRPQPGSFYGGWITDNLIGPFKGGPSSLGW
jgi:uncharacterized protein (DUF427 family)